MHECHNKFHFFGRLHRIFIKLFLASFLVGAMMREDYPASCSQLSYKFRFSTLPLTEKDGCQRMIVRFS